jgi:Transcriptional regulators
MAAARYCLLMVKPKTSPQASQRSPRAPQHASAAVAPLARKTLGTATLEAIRHGILDGTYAEGAQLRQDALAVELGVSRIPVREALRQLESEGLATFTPHHGAVVSSFSIAEIEELFELRAMIETDLIRRSVPRLTNEDLKQAAGILDAYEEALSSGDVGAWGELNWRFHSMLYAPAQRALTMRVVETLHHHADRYARMQLALTHGELRAKAEHRAIIAACRKGNVRDAAKLMREHILGAGQSLVRFLGELRESQSGRAVPQGSAPANRRGRSRRKSEGNGT